MAPPYLEVLSISKLGNDEYQRVGAELSMCPDWLK